MIDTPITVFLWLLFAIAVLQPLVWLYRRRRIRRLDAEVDIAYKNAGYERCAKCRQYHVAMRCPP